MALDTQRDSAHAVAATHRTNCRSHCSGCGRHFTSTRAFDMHRKGPHSTGRWCADPRTDSRLVTAVGNCTLTAKPYHGVVVWVLSARERVQESPQASSASELDPS